MRAVAILGTALLAALVGAMATSGGQTAWAVDKEPPSCAAVTFRPVPSGLNDGEQDAGLYKSRFGRIEVKAVVKGGEPQEYFVEVNGKRPQAISGALPKGISACAKAKRLGPIDKPQAACRGDKLAVLVEHAGDHRYIVLYAHQGNEWRFCSAGTA